MRASRFNRLEGRYARSETVPLGVVAKMKSDSEMSEVLNLVVRNHRIDDALRPAFDKAVDAIDSDYYRGSVLSAVRRRAAQ